MAEIKIGDIGGILDGSTIDDLDLFIVSDVSESETKKLTFGELREKVVSDNFFEVNSQDIVDALNGFDYNPAAPGTVNQLNATNLYHDTGEVATTGYKPSTYFLDYTNFTNTPDLLQNLSDLYNNDNYLQLDTTVSVGVGNAGRLVVKSRSIDNGIVTEGSVIDVTTKYITESDTNLYYTEQRVENFFDDNFGRFYNQYTAAFDGGLIRDSLTETEASFTGVGIDSQSNALYISYADDAASAIPGIGKPAGYQNDNPNIADNYQKGQKLRIYGASLDAVQEDLDAFIGSGFSFSVVSAGFVSTGGVESTKHTFSYKVCLFDLESGKITKATTSQEEVFMLPVDGVSSTNVFDQFNPDYFVRLNFSSIPPGKGILVYRSVGAGNLVGPDYKLTAVLGTRETVENRWVDYFTFDYTPWSGKTGKFIFNSADKLDNTYAWVIHFPTTAPADPYRGWVDVEILSSVNNTASERVELILSSSVYVNNPATATVSHNDTNVIQSAINANSAIGRKNILLNAKTYVSGGLELPDKFGLQGTTAVTKILRLPWSGGENSSLNTKMIKAQTLQGAETLTLVGIDLDGNLKHSFLFNDAVDPKLNYAIDFGSNALDVTLDRVRLLNVPGGGVYAPGITNLKITTCDFLNSGINDRYDFSPLVADAAFTTLVIGSRFENYTDNINVSLTDQGVIANNIISNCGTGLFIYGSRFFVSSPNVLVGPANEFLPTPDVLSSEYDLINIDLTEAYLSDDQFLSDNFVYSENGSAYNLLQTNRNGYTSQAALGTPENATETGQIFYTTTGLKKNLTTGVESFYYPQVEGFSVISPVDGAPGINATTYKTAKSQGEFGFAIPAAVVKSIKESPFLVDGRVKGDLTFTSNTITSPVDGTDLSGFVNGQTIVISESDNPLNDNDGTYTVSGNSTTNLLTITANAFTPDTPVGALIYQSGVGIRSYTILKAKDPEHVGWVWSASYEHEVRAGIILGAGKWLYKGLSANEYDYDGNGVPTTDVVYQVNLTNVEYISANIEEGSRVKFINHTSFSSGSNDGTGIVIEASENGGIWATKIRFNGANPTDISIVNEMGNFIDSTLTVGTDNSQTGDAAPQINIIDKFVLAQGRIL